MIELKVPNVDMGWLLDRKLILQSQLFDPGDYPDMGYLLEVVNEIRRIDSTLSTFSFNYDVMDEPI